MKARELMIGDWVRNALLNEVFKMNTTSMRNMCWDEDNGMARYTIEPIPLTKEILEANGFSIAYSSPTHTMLRLYEESKFGVQCKIFARHPEEVRIMIRGYNKSCIEIVVNYVHEFQRALRCCGLNDLADNFKID